jgi:ParB-like chromosome segregation protein Spo0J
MKNRNDKQKSGLKDLQFHELANIFPMMNDDRFIDLVEDIRQNGLHDPIDLYEGKVLDGRNRYKACLIAGVEPRGYEYTGDDPLKYVLSKNLHRRHMDESQRAMVAANIANLEKGGDGSNQHEKSKSANLQNSLSVAQAAEAVNVGVRSVSAAKKVKADGDDALQSLVVAGELPVSVAEAFTKIVSDRKRQAEIIETQGAEGIKDIVKEDRKAKKTEREKKKNEKTKAKGGNESEKSKEEIVGSSIQFAEFAILQLERIQDWDTHKLEAVQLVEDWIVAKRKVWNRGK